MILPPIHRVALCCAISSLLAHTSPAALENYWALDEFAGTVAPNLVQGGQAGLLFNGVTWAFDPFRGQVLQFDGIDGYVDAGFSPQMTLANDYTWSFWSNSALPSTTTTGDPPTTAQNNNVIIGNRYNSSNGEFSPREFVKFTQTNWEFHRSGAAENLNYVDMPQGIWVHSVAVKQGATLTYFRNGHFAGSRTITEGLNNPQPLYFGGSQTAENWQGMLDDVATWSNAMPLSSIVQIAKGTATPQNASTAPTVFAPVMTDDFSSGLSKWTVTNRGLENNGQAGFAEPDITDGRVTLSGTATGQYWYGKSLESNQRFDSSIETLISVDRISLTGSGPTTSGRFRSSLWLLGDDGHYLHFSQNMNEGGWSWNARDDGGLGTLMPTGSGTNLTALDSLDLDGGQHKMSLQLVPTGLVGGVFVYMLLDGNIVASHEFTNFPSTFQVVLTGQARAIDDHVSAVFDNLSVSIAVPEPSTALLIGAAAFGAFGRRRRNAIMR